MDYYQILGVSKTASAQELKDAYRKLAKEHHPDKNPGDKKAEQKFKEINAAYDILKDDQKRAAYDRYGEAAFQNGGGGAGGFGGGGFDFSGSSFADIFEDLFSGGMGGGRRGAQPNLRGSDLRHNMNISLEEAWRGEKQTITFATQSECESCHGSGSADAHGSTTCSTCAGMGKVRIQQGFFTLERTCTTCQGTGHVIANPCKSCNGAGRTRKSKTLSVNIPAGVEEGTRIRLSGEGEAGMRGSPSGDLYIFVSIKPHPIFQREGNDLHCEVPIPMTTAVLGGTLDVPTIDGGKARITVPAGTQSGHQFRLKSKGMPVMRRSSSYGDMYVHAAVETPVNLTRKQRELLEQFAAESGEKQQPETHKFYGKMEKFLFSFKKS